MSPKRKITKSGAVVYFGSAHVVRADAAASLPAKLERILNKVDLERLCQGAWVPIKMHLGGGLGYTMIHPVFVNIVVKAVKAAGGKPFVVDGLFGTIATAAERGYTAETLGCPIVSAGGPYDAHIVKRKVNFPGLDEINAFGAIWDAPCLINFSHIKGHGVCSYGGACKNIAMGCVDKLTRGRLHALSGGIDWIKDRCRLCGRCVKACDTGAVSLDKKKKAVSFFWHDCRFCAHCVTACPHGALAIRARDGFRRFQEGLAVTTKAILDSFDQERILHINLLTNISMLCDCWGMSSPSIVPDIGVMASRDMVAIETATLKAIEAQHFIPGSLIGNRRLMKGRHLLERIHGKDPFLQIRALERHGVGLSRYRLIDVS
ncbi:MAG: DUF362 domain-containing protein [Kiritimatiellae bacterium]|nr:DUF362 domain-containing protein [Verrucomicrobiota bacterium]MBU4285873.1 DUF362 domain-containing protein [Verrucomicrobiota bacterium]MBU4366198.1 DUF362 domain-containing protein [Verrucomicrobiota bacterium]MCG2658987.1 DUF362 domain-containing protein [Kiritimatiellia bacterium]